jgi:hypothetical protein
MSADDAPSTTASATGAAAAADAKAEAGTSPPPPPSDAAAEAKAKANEDFKGEGCWEGVCVCRVFFFSCPAAALPGVSARAGEERSRSTRRKRRKG